MALTTGEAARSNAASSSTDPASSSTTQAPSVQAVPCDPVGSQSDPVDNGSSRVPRDAEPFEAGEWKVVPVHNGWLRYSKVKKRLDAHCSVHGPTCKADRILKKAPLGFLMAWLACPCESKELHDIEKIVVYSRCRVAIKAPRGTTRVRSAGCITGRIVCRDFAV